MTDPIHPSSSQAIEAAIVATGSKATYTGAGKPPHYYQLESQLEHRVDSAPRTLRTFMKAPHE